MNTKTKNIRLYVKCVFISDGFDMELFPKYLNFVKGVVDSNDLPLNVSREILKESRIVRIMRSRLVRKAFDMILGISTSENNDDYDNFWDNYGKYLKLCCIEDQSNHKRLAPLLQFFSSQSDSELISLDEYVENMKQDQKDIYYVASDSITSAKNAPFLERLLQKEYEVVVSTKTPKFDKQYVWEAEANTSSFTIREETDPEKLLPRGTGLTLFLKRDDKGYAHPERILKLLKNYSQFVSFPIYTWEEKGFTKEIEIDGPADSKEGEDSTVEKKKKTKKVVEKYWEWELANET